MSSPVLSQYMRSEKELLFITLYFHLTFHYIKILKALSFVAGRIPAAAVVLWLLPLILVVLYNL